MPPVLNSLGPITDWLILFGPVIEKYDAVNKASSADKVSHKVASLALGHKRCTVYAAEVFLQSAM